jgi:c-di-GMP-binding flagellar brake protein YcgR
MPSETIPSHSKEDDVILLPGLLLGVPLQVEFMGIGTAWSCLVGMDTGKFLIIRTPPIVGLWSKINNKNQVIIRYMFSGQVYAFRCTLVELVKKPYNLSILSYPEEIEHMNLRHHERISCNITADITIENKLYEGIVSDISMGGCCVELNRTNYQVPPELKINDKITLAIHLREKAEASVFAAIMRTIRTDSQKIIIGLNFTKASFIEKDIETKKELQYYMLTLTHR